MLHLSMHERSAAADGKVRESSCRSNVVYSKYSGYLTESSTLGGDRVSHAALYRVPDVIDALGG